MGGSRLEAEEHSVAAGLQVTLPPPSGPCPLLYRFTQPRPGGRCKTTIPENTEGEGGQKHEKPTLLPLLVRPRGTHTSCVNTHTRLNV